MVHKFNVFYLVLCTKSNYKKLDSELIFVYQTVSDQRGLHDKETHRFIPLLWTSYIKGSNGKTNSVRWSIFKKKKKNGNVLTVGWSDLHFLQFSKMGTLLLIDYIIMRSI